MEDTSGFYKLDTELLFAPNGVIGVSYELHRESMSSYELPIDGWYWFDTKADAAVFFNIVLSDDPVGLNT